MRGLALNFASTHQVGNSAGISKVGENKQLLIAIVVCSYFLSAVIRCCLKNCSGFSILRDGFGIMSV
ncbi:MAG: hypothetical protein CL624_08975 [Arcobacter sp.]|nr:hypothetical protein [Arcobacter sp.]